MHCSFSFQALPHTDLGVHEYCQSCGKHHVLSTGRTIELGVQLMNRLESLQHIDLLSKKLKDMRFATTNLFGEQRGKMFGILEGIDPRGNEKVLYAFSGQYNGLWNIPGWAPPLFEEEIWISTNFTTEKKIKKLSRELENLENGTSTFQKTKRLRKKLSQDLMIKLHQLYEIHNFRGETSTLEPFFKGKQGIPTGTGDCCAPKLLNYAVQHEILPLGIAEFYWGKTNKSSTRKHGCFYPPCAEKCKPLLAFFLCGLEERKKQYSI